jgi:hypothetical protein
MSSHILLEVYVGHLATQVSRIGCIQNETLMGLNKRLGVEDFDLRKWKLYKDSEP